MQVSQKNRLYYGHKFSRVLPINSCDDSVMESYPIGNYFPKQILLLKTAGLSLLIFIHTTRSNKIFISVRTLDIGPEFLIFISQLRQECDVAYRLEQV